MSNIAEQLKSATETLTAAGVADARREATSLLVLALEKDKTFLIAHSDYELSMAEEIRFREFVERRARREPFQYIAGRQEFYKLDFAVTNDVLIPRPETERLVEAAIEILRRRSAPRFCEIGVGSGCISVSILHSLKEARAVGADISERALRVAAKNAERHGVAGRLELKISDVFDRLANEKFDLIAANPPYISIEDFRDLQPEVRDFEPRFALTDGENGLTIIEKIVKDAPDFLKPDSFLLVEIGFGQADEARALFEPRLWQTIEILPDLQGIPRTIRARTRA